MDYRCTVTMAKAMSQVVMHIEVARENASGWTSRPVYQRTELLDEEAHPDPSQWAKAHLARFLEFL